MSPRWLHWPAAAGNDWDTNEVARSGSITFPGDTSYVTCTFTPSSSTELDLIDQCRMTPSVPTVVQLRDLGSGLSSLDTEVPYIAMWRASDLEWFVLPVTVISTSICSYDIAAVEIRSGSGSLANTDTCIIVGLSSYTPGDVTSWSNYS